MFGLLQNNQQKNSDQQEIFMLIAKYGDDTREVLIRRSNDKSLKRRDRLHWYRLSKKTS